MIKRFLSIIICFLLVFFIKVSTSKIVFAENKNAYWEIQSVDTMKYSRDLARERNGDKVFERLIESYVAKIASVGVTHVAVGTPYDEEFIPFLEKWVKAARQENINVWFRGNFSGWEGWFDYPGITPLEHTKKIEKFILENQNLFEDGDIFTPCTECENGKSGDPRDTRDVSGYREFLIKEHETSGSAFEKIGKNVASGYFSMNADVADLIMDKETTNALGGIVVIDHYVKNPSELSQDVENLAEKSGGKIVLGEIGAPIPDIHGPMTDETQSIWLSEVLNNLSKEPKLKGINYWVSFGGTTAVWRNDGSEKPSVDVLRNYYLTDKISGKVYNELGRPVKDAHIIADSKETYSGSKGEFEIISNPSLKRIIINAGTYKENIFDLNKDYSLEKIILEKEKEDLFFKIFKVIFKLLENVKSKFQEVK